MGENRSLSNGQEGNVPRLRFPGFEGEWTRNRLDEVAFVNPASPEIPRYFYYIDLESVDTGILSEIKEITKSDAPSRAQRVVCINDILFQTVRPYQKNNYFMQEEFDLPVVASTGYAQIRTENNPYFLYSSLHTKRFLNNVLLRCTGSSYPAINSNDLKEIEIYTPCQLEQSKISLFMSLIDKRIEKQKQLIETVKKYKRGLLSAVFPRNGHVTPKYRLSRFSKPWEQRKLGEIILDHIEKKPKGENLPILTSSRQGIQKQEEHFASEQKHDTTDYNVIPMGYCTYRNRSDDRTFTFNVNNCVQRGIVSKFYPVFMIEKGNAKFITEYLNTNAEIRNKIAVLAVGTSQVVLSLTNLKRLKVMIPSKEEQDRIGQVITNLDSLITHHQSMLKLFTKFKIGLLQQLFI